MIGPFLGMGMLGDWANQQGGNVPEQSNQYTLPDQPAFGVNPYVPKPLKSVSPLISFMSEKIAQNHSQGANNPKNKDILTRADENGETYLDQLVSDASLKFEEARKLREGYNSAMENLNSYTDPRVEEVLTRLQSQQSRAPVMPTPTTPDAPNYAQRVFSAIASLYSPRLGLQYQGIPYAHNKQVALEQDQRAMAQFQQADNLHKNNLSSLTTEYGIATRAEDNRRKSMLGAANSQGIRAENAEKIALDSLGKVMQDSQRTLDRGAKLDIAGANIEQAQNKLAVWVLERGKQLAETIRFHDGMLNQRDKDLSLGWARLEAADKMDAFIMNLKTDEEKLKWKEYQQKLITEGNKLVEGWNGNAWEIDQKVGGINSVLGMLYGQVRDGIQAGTFKGDNDPKLQEIYRQIGAQKTLLKVYANQRNNLAQKVQDITMQQAGAGGAQQPPGYEAQIVPGSGTGQPANPVGGLTGPIGDGTGQAPPPGPTPPSVKKGPPPAGTPQGASNPGFGASGEDWYKIQQGRDPKIQLPNAASQMTPEEQARYKGQGQDAAKTGGQIKTDSGVVKYRVVDKKKKKGS